MIKNITAPDLKHKLESTESILLIDCREQYEWDTGHIESAVLYPLSLFDDHAKKLNDKNCEIIIQCRSGVRSMKACQLLESLGFTNLSNLEGGIMSWAQCQFPISQK